MGLVEMLEVFNLGSPTVVVIAICVFMAVFGYRVQRLERTVDKNAVEVKITLERTAASLKQDFTDIRDNIKADMEKTKEKTVWWDTCKAKHVALDHRITRLETLANGGLNGK